MKEDKSESGHTKVLPFLRWAGSKKQHVPRLSLFWSDKYSRYVEPFAGSAVLFFHINPKRALLGDINKELISTLKTVRSHPTRVSHVVSSIPKGKKHYNELRETDPATLGPIMRAARFIYLNRYCFNGLYRTNSKGEFNVPYGGGKTGALPSAEQLRNSARLLKRAKLVSWDFRRTLERVRKGDFVYLDPPYAVGNRRVFVEYGAKPFTLKDVTALGKLLRRISRKGAKFVLSYADCSEAREAFSKWKVRRIRTRRSVAGFLGARRDHYELCVTNLRAKISKG
jgi:DNA adenine methylase